MVGLTVRRLLLHGRHACCSNCNLTLLCPYSSAVCCSESRLLCPYSPGAAAFLFPWQHCGACDSAPESQALRRCRWLAPSAFSTPKDISEADPNVTQGNLIINHQPNVSRGNSIGVLRIALERRLGKATRILAPPSRAPGSATPVRHTEAPPTAAHSCSALAAVLGRMPTVSSAD
jgi:hypothetical protein